MEGIFEQFQVNQQQEQQPLQGDVPQTRSSTQSTQATTGGGGGGGLTDAFSSLGDAIHDNTNDSISVMTQYMDIMKKYEHLAKQLEFEKDKFGLEFALKKLMSMAQLNALEKQVLMMELKGREEVKTSAQARHITDYQFRQQKMTDEKKQKIGKAFMSGIADAMKGSQKKRGGDGGDGTPPLQMPQKEENIMSSFQ